MLSCQQHEDKPKTATFSASVESKNTIKDSVKLDKKKPAYFQVKNLADAFEYSKDSYLVDDLYYLSNIDAAPLIKYLEIPDEFPILKKSLENIDTDYAGAIFYNFDFTGDGIDDLIYSSNFGAEERHTVFWAKEKDSYRFIQFVWGSLEKLFRKHNNKPYSLIIVSGFCCGSFIGDYTIYQPDFKNKKLFYSKKKNFKVFLDLEKPVIVIPPITFQITNKPKYLRLSPRIDNSVDTVLSLLGNIIAEFKIGSKGTAISLKKDSLKNWWFVIMDTSSQTLKSNFYDDKYSHKVGWMSSENLKIIDGGL